MNNYYTNQNSNYQNVKSPIKNRIRESKPRIIRSAIIIFFGMCLLSILIGASVFFWDIASSPQITPSVMSSDNSTRIYDSSGHQIFRLGAKNRVYTKYNQIPKQFVDALTSIEDKNFFTERGVEPQRIVSAELSDLGGSSLQGGSTLTQQLVKLSVFSTSTSEQTVKRKAQEAWLSMKISRKYPKSEIFEFYINKVFMGYNTYGIGTAARFYYGKPLNKLQLPQLAMLAGMPQSPVAYDPYSHPKLAQQRRNQVLDAMQKNGKLNAQQVAQAKKVSVQAGLAKKHPANQQNFKNEQLIDGYIKAALVEMHTHHLKLHDGLKIYTNINMNQQKTLYNMANKSSEPGFPNKAMQIGAALVNPKNGNVGALIGGRQQKQPFGLDRALQMTHSNGSTNKPLMDYGPAVQYLKLSPDSTVEDTPFTYPGTHTKLYDFDHDYKGNMTARDALVQSRNIPAIRLLQKVSVPRAIQFMSGLGIQLNNSTNLQNGIGEYVSPLQEASAYATFADNGIYHQPNLINHIVAPNGRVKHFNSVGHRAMSPQTAYVITDMMAGVFNNPEDGLDARVSGLHEAGKTGTTEYPANYKGYLPSYAAMDSWFAGYTPDFSLAIWTGYDKPLQQGHYLDIHQINIPLKYYRGVMQSLTRNKKINPNWYKPKQVKLW